MKRGVHRTRCSPTSFRHDVTSHRRDVARSSTWRWQSSGIRAVQSRKETKTAVRTLRPDDGAASTSETSVYSTRPHSVMTEGCLLHACRREKITSHLFLDVFHLVSI